MATTPILYGFLPTSPTIPTRTRHVRATWLANELDIPLQFENVDLATGEHKKPAFLALNPLGQVPVLKDGDVTLTESCAIVLYLAEKHAEKGLYPSTLHARAMLHQLAFFIVSAVEPAVFDMFLASDKTPFGTPNTEKYHEARKKFIATLGPVIGSHIGNGPFVLGEQFSVADVIVAYPLAFLDFLGELEHFPVINEYFQRLAQRKAYKAAFAPAPTLYGEINPGPIKTRAARCHWIAKELNAPLHVHPIDLTKQENQTPEFLALNPLGQVPTLRDGDLVLTESSAIAAYLAESHVEKGLYPATVQDRARLSQLISLMTSTVEPLLTELLVTTSVSLIPDVYRQPSEEKFQKAKEKWVTKIGPFLEKLLGDRPYLLGDGFTVADVVVGYPLQMAHVMNLLSDLPTLGAYHERLSQRPAFIACCTDRTA